MPWGEPDDKEPKKNIHKPSPWDKINNNDPGVNFDDIFSKGFEKLKNFLNNNGGDNNSKIIILIVTCIVLLWFSTGLYIVDEGEEAVVMRFGKVVRTGSTGLNYHLPEPIESIILEQVKKVRKIELGFKSSNNYKKSSGSASSDVSQDSLMLTGDENILSVHFVVQWSIRDLEKYIFNVMDPEETVRSASVSAMREVIGNTDMVSAQTSGRLKVQDEARQIAQNILDSYGSGVEISLLQLQGIEPPSEVVEAFRDVQTAKADKESAINQAQAYQNDILPKARGEASQLIEDSEAYKKEVIANATGEANRFNLVYNEYVKAKQVTKKRIYLETMESVLSDIDKVIIDNSKGQGVFPFLQLPKIEGEKK